MCTAIKHPVPDQAKPSFVIFDIWALWHSRLRVRVSGCKNYKWRLNPVWQRMLSSCTHMATVGVKGLMYDAIVWRLNVVQRKEVILPCFKPLQRGIAACMNCPNTRVIRMVHSLLSRLMSVFPTESATSSVASKFEELECLYACVSKIVYEGLANYEKSVIPILVDLYTVQFSSIYICIAHWQCLWCTAVVLFVSIYKKNVLAGVWNNQTKDLTTLNNPVRHSSRLDQRHWTHGCRRLTVCSVVRPSCWLWRTEDRHDDLLTQWQAYTVQSGTLEPAMPCRHG